MNPLPPDPSGTLDVPTSGHGTSTLGAWVRTRRRDLGLTVERLAVAVGCSKGHLSAIETGRHVRPGDELLRRLESALACEPGMLLGMAYISDTPAPVRRELSLLRDRQRDAGRLAALLGGLGGTPAQEDDLRGGTPGQTASGAGDGLTWPTGRTALDQAHSSGELRRLINRLSPPEPVGVPPGPASDPSAGSGSGAGPGPGPRPSPEDGHSDAHCARDAHPCQFDAGMAVALRAALPQEVPLINRVAAGYPTEFTDLGYPARVADEYVRCPDIADADAFAARVIGDSMLPDYREGDIVIFSPARDVRAGSDCFARIEPDHESTFKRVFFERDSEGEELIRLQPLNPAYPPRTLPREHVAGLYAAVTVMRRIG